VVLLTFKDGDLKDLPKLKINKKLKSRNLG